jgi:hypothetical protein
MPLSPLTNDWANFFVAEVGASAALTGLLVVAISINLSRILAISKLPERAAEGLIILTGALVIASIGLVPNQPVTLFGSEVLAIGLVTFLVAAVIQLRSPGGVPRGADEIFPARQLSAFDSQEGPGRPRRFLRGASRSAHPR